MRARIIRLDKNDPALSCSGMAACAFGFGLGTINLQLFSLSAGVRAAAIARAESY